MTQQGVDVSNFQHPNGAGINWAAVHASGVTWAAVLVSDGMNFVNPYAAGDLAAAAAADVYTMAYHFGRPGNVAADEANHFLSQCPPGIPVCLDIEVTNNFAWDLVAAWAHTFLDTLAASGRFVALYCNVDFLKSMPGAPWGYTLWLADPSNVDPTAIRAATQVSIGTVPGIPDQVDEDRFADDATFGVFFGHQVLAPAATPPPPVNPTPPWYRRYGPWHRRV